MPSSPTDSAPRAWIVHAESSAPTTIWGLTPEERLQRSLRIAGCAEIASSRAGEPFAAPASSSVVVLRGDALFDPRVIEALIAAPGTLLLAPWHDATRGGTPVASDRVLATRLGVAAADFSIDGLSNVMVAMKATRIVPVPLAEATSAIRGVPQDIYETAETFFG